MESEDITTEGLPPESRGDGEGEDEGGSAADEAQENEEESTDG